MGSASSNSSVSTSAWRDPPRFARPSHRYQPLVYVALALSLGIVVDRYVHSESLSALGISQFDAAPTCLVAYWLGALVVLGAWWRAWCRRRDRFAACLLLLATSLSGAAWHDFRWSRFRVDEIARFAADEPAPAAIELVVRHAPERVPAPRETALRAIPGVDRTRLIGDVVRVRDGARWRAASGSVQLGVDGHLLGVERGDRLRVFGQLALVRPPMNPGEFDFACHARSDRELARVNSSSPEGVTVVSRARSTVTHRLLDRIRLHCERLIRRFIGPDQSGLASAILLGSRADLPRDATDPYMFTGTIHVLVVSGMNVAILTLPLLGAMRFGWLSRRVALVAIGAIAIAYALLAHGQPPVVRAAVIAVLMCVASWSGRPVGSFNSLGAAAIITLTLNPADLFRVGPQLSFLGVGALIWISSWPLVRRPAITDRLEQLIEATRPWHDKLMSWTEWRVIGAFAIALFVWLAAVPLVMYRFNLVTPVAVLISPVVSLIVSVALYSGFIVLLCGELLGPVAVLAGALCAKSLAWLEAVVLWAEALPASHFWFPSPSWWWVVAFYIGLLVAMLFGRRLVPLRWQVAALSAWIVVGLIPPLVRSLTTSDFSCSFVSVGHGTCVVVHTPAGRTLLYDAGSLGSPERASRSVASYLWHRGIARIDGIVLSHSDVDHYNAVPGLLERFHVGAIYVSPLMFEDFGDLRERDGPDELRAAIARAGVPIREVWAGDRLRLDPDVVVDVVHPTRLGVLGSDNANSIVLTIQYDGHRILLPGDLESPGIEDVMAGQPYDCEILMAPHHGSRLSDPPGFAAWSRPDWVVISGGGGHELGTVVDTYQQAKAVVLRTHLHGAVEFAIGGGNIRASTWREAMAGPTKR